MLRRSRIVRVMVPVLAVALAALAAPGSPAGPEPAAATACAVHKKQNLYIYADETTTEQRSRVDSDGHVQHQYPKYVINGRDRKDIGRVTLHVSLCRINGVWKIDRIGRTGLHYDLDFLIGSDRETHKNVVKAVYVTDEHYGKGYQLVFRKVWKDLTVELEVDRCTPKPMSLSQKMQQYARLITSIPLPGGPAVTVGQFVGSALIPGATKRSSKCARMGDVALIKLTGPNAHGKVGIERVMREARTLWYNEDEAGSGCPGGPPYTEICRVQTEERVTFSTTAN